MPQYKTLKPPPRRTELSFYSPTEQIVYDALIARLEASDHLDHESVNVSHERDVLKEATDFKPIKSIYKNLPPYNVQESGDAFVTKETLRNHTIQVKPEQSSPMEVVTHISRENIVIDLNQPYKDRLQQPKDLSNHTVTTGSNPKSGVGNLICKPRAAGQLMALDVASCTEDAGFSRYTSPSASHTSDRGSNDNNLMHEIMSIHSSQIDHQPQPSTPPKKSFVSPTPSLHFSATLNKSRKLKRKRPEHVEQLPVNTYSCDEYIRKNGDELLAAIPHSKAIVLLHTDRQGILNRFIQTSLAKDGTCTVWESFITPLVSNRSHTLLHCYRRLFKECFKRSPVCNDAKSVISGLIKSNILTVEDLQNLVFDDLTVSEWLLNTDYFSKRNKLQTDNANTDAQRNRLALDCYKRSISLSERLAEDNLTRVYKLEISLIPILVSMEVQGIRVDQSQLKHLDTILEKEIKEIENKTKDVIGTPVQLSSHAQLRQILFDRLRLDQKLPQCIGKTSKGHQKSTSEGTLVQLKPYHPLPSLILQHRQLTKISNTFMKGIAAFVVDGYLKPTWDQTTAVSGRLQSTKPNIQGIPKTPSSWITGDTEHVVHPRSIYISREGYTFLSIDYKQMEFRILTHMTGDTRLQEIVKNERDDIFKTLSSMWLQKHVNDVSEMDRDRTKKIVYSVMYGIGRARLAENLAITPMEAQSIMGRFMKQFPSINRFISEATNKCRHQGFMTSLLGRRRYFPNINDSDFKERSRVERQAVNFCIQGTAADVCKMAMVEADKKLKEQCMDARLILQLHDELLYEVVDEDLPCVSEILKSSVEIGLNQSHKDIELKVPLTVAMRVGKCWAFMS